jgi:hypothetical protein
VSVADGYLIVTFSSSYMYNLVGSMQSFVVPPSMYIMSVDVYGARGGNSFLGAGGRGARVKAVFYVTAGNPVYYTIGGKGNDMASANHVGGFNFGGASGSTPGAGGGGSTDLRLLATNNVVIIAGGGGGASNTTCSGFPNGGNSGMYGQDGSVGGEKTGGGGATQSSGGAAGCQMASATACGQSGTDGVGGLGYGSGGGAGVFGGKYAPDIVFTVLLFFCTL